MSARIALVACGASKLPHAAPAAELYTSQLFRKSAAYAAATCDRWYVLSARHGLVAPETVLEPYDQRLERRTADAWAAGVREQLQLELDGIAGVRLVALAGELYRAVLRPCAWPFEIPMRGLGIGEQLGFLTAALRELEAAA